MAKKSKKEQEVMSEDVAEDIEDTCTSEEDDDDVQPSVESKLQTDVVLKSIAKKYGSVVSKLSEVSSNITTVSTGSLGLDSALGRGGMALGRIYEVYGPHSSGKSTLGINVVIQAQRRGMRCAYFDAEHAVDPKLFKNYGANCDELLMIRAYGGEDNLDILERLLKSNTVDVCVVDSVSALLPKVEAEADIDKEHMALLARLMSKAMRKITPIAAETKTLIIFVNQIRRKLGTYGSPETTSGGEALSFYATGRIHVKGPEAKARRIEDPTTGLIIGHTAIHEVEKNKLGEPYKKANLRLMYGKGYDFHWEVLEMATSLNIIEKVGSYYRYNGENIGHGDAKTLDKLRDDSEFFDKIRREVIDFIGLGEQYEQHFNPGPLYARSIVSSSTPQESVL